MSFLPYAKYATVSELCISTDLRQLRHLRNPRDHWSLALPRSHFLLSFLRYFCPFWEVFSRSALSIHRPSWNPRVFRKRHVGAELHDKPKTRCSHGRTHYDRQYSNCFAKYKSGSFLKIKQMHMKCLEGSCYFLYRSILIFATSVL